MMSLFDGVPKRRIFLQQKKKKKKQYQGSFEPWINLKPATFSL